MKHKLVLTFAWASIGSAFIAGLVIVAVIRKMGLF